MYIFISAYLFVAEQKNNTFHYQNKNIIFCNIVAIGIKSFKRDY